MHETLKLLLVLGATLGSLKTTFFLGRLVNIGDFFALALIPFVIVDYLRAQRSKKATIGGVEIAWIIFILALATQATLVGELMNGAFLNGYRTLVLSLVLYYAGRTCNTSTKAFKWQMVGFFGAYAYLLNEYKSEFSERTSGDTIHLVGFEGGELGLNVSNLNLYGLLWVSLVLLSIATYLRTKSKILPVVMFIVALPGLISSVSRAAFVMYALLGLFLLFAMASKEGKVKAIFIPLILLGGGAIAFYRFSEFGEAMQARLADKTEAFWQELFSERLGELMWTPISEFASRANGAKLLLGEFSFPQHNSIANAFVMFGISGFAVYLLFIASQFHRGIKTYKRKDKKGRQEGALYLLAFGLYFANDLATNSLYYSAAASYLFYFSLGLLVPIQDQHEHTRMNPRREPA